jgi:hypothetical protein
MERLSCRDDARRYALRREMARGARRWNGLDYLEVEPDQTTLAVYFIGKLPPELSRDSKLLPGYVRIEGGRRVRDIKVLDVDPHVEPDPELDDYLVVRVDKPGDFSTYTLRLVGVENIDPRYDHLAFTFKIDCPSDLDCAAAPPCPHDAPDEPEINYLAKDYASFRQLVYDRLSVVMPDWRERHAPDLGVALVELLAYVGDYLSYYQDAVATEAYLDTARRRISVRRHARLVDYVMHEGANARALVAVETGTNFALDPAACYFVTDVNDALPAGGGALAAADLSDLPAGTYEVFEPLVPDPRRPIELYAAHSEIHFYTWGDRECCLPRGATTATLADAWVQRARTDEEGGVLDQQSAPARQGRPQAEPPAPGRENFARALKLKAGDILIFEEVMGPQTGARADADLSHRQAVRLTRVTPGEDPIVTAEVHAPGRGAFELPSPVLEIEWAEEDALPFPLCLSSVGRAPGCVYLDNVSVARGNVILVDHGRTLPPEDLGAVPLQSSGVSCDCAGHPGETSYTAGRFEPRLARAPLTHAARLDPRAPAARTLAQDARRALPQLRLYAIPPAPAAAPLFELGDLTNPSGRIERAGRKPPFGGLSLSRNTRTLLAERPEGAAPSDELRAAFLADLRAMLRQWEPRYDLIESGGEDRQFVVETDDEGVAHLRFGDGELGARPEAGADFFAQYRVGNGARGNVGAEAIRHLVMRRERLNTGAHLSVRNPLAALGGTEPEPAAEVKLYAPGKFRKRLERAVIAADYARLAEREFPREVQRAAAGLTWTGSWYEASVAVDALARAAEESSERALFRRLDGRLHRYRRMGHDVAVRAARRVPIDLALRVCARPGYLRGDVKAALLKVFSNRQLVGGRRGLFHPDSLTFGQSIYLSRLVAAAQAVAGVESVQVTKLQRLFEAPNREIENGVLPLGPFEVAQLDNDPSFPEHGRLAVEMRGGR